MRITGGSHKCEGTGFAVRVAAILGVASFAIWNGGEVPELPFAQGDRQSYLELIDPAVTSSVNVNFILLESNPEIQSDIQANYPEEQAPCGL